jgi:hypothetical protein
VDELAQSIVALLPKGFVKQWELMPIHPSNAHITDYSVRVLKMKLTNGKYAALKIEEGLDPHNAAQRIKGAR